MRRGWIRITAAIALAICLLFSVCCSASALDDKYTFDDIGMAIRVPKTYSVITRDSAREDEVFRTLGLDYDETITAFSAANIYLRAYAPDDTFTITLTVSKDDNSVSVNNYSDLTSAQRDEVEQLFLADPSCSSATQLKHGGNIFYDLVLTGAVNGETAYINQCNTIINGMNINLALWKEKEPATAEELKSLTNMANSISFEKIVLRNSGPSFEWWRILLWVLILGGVTVASSFLYKRYNKNKKQQRDERRRAHEAARRQRAEKEAADATLGDDPEPPMSFEESLGYETDSDFKRRAATDLEQFDINVRTKNPNRGIDYFEDDGESIDDGTDYFDKYFKEPTEHKSGAARAAGTAGAYIKIAFTHLGFFFKNLWKTIVSLFKKK